MRKTLWLAATVFLSACAASWSSVVRYSDVPAPAGADAEEGVYETTLAWVVGKGVDSVVYQRYPVQQYPADAAQWADSQVSPFWVDTLKRELHRALTSPALWMAADSDRIMEAAAVRHTVLVRTQTDDTLAFLVRRARTDTHYRFPPIISFSRPGFNADSTLAAIQVSALCGPLCGSSQTLFLARRPGTAWRVWGGHLGWQS